ncbi:MAG TPA: putative Ig domain-containing protein, partial [Candidatus Acidoferrales bacterium]|nr:putative Ig domain-containing protein [Candidatus Acidoferrales bacterium]
MTTSMTYARTTDSTSTKAQKARHLVEPAIPALLGTLCFAILMAAGCHSSAPAITVQVQPSTAISIDEGQSINFTATVANDTQNLGVSWSLVQTSSTTCSGSGCGTLSKMTNSSVTYTAPTGLSAGESVTLTVASVAQPTATATATISVVLPPVYSTITLPNGSNGVAYNQTISVTGGVAPLTFSLQPGSSLPQGLTLTSAGTIVGKPSAPTLGGQITSYSFTVLVTDTPVPLGTATPLSVAQAYTISIAPPSALSINTTTFATATSNTRYTPPPISATGGVLPLTWSLVSGSLPPGLALNPTTGQISGVVPEFFPTGSTTSTAGTYTFRVQAKDQTLPTSQTVQSQNLSITVQAPQPLTITTATPLTPGITATPYNQSLVASGGIQPYTWTITSGLLPSGLSLAANGILSGTPVLVMTNDNFTVQVQDSEVTPQMVSEPLTISIAAGSGNGNSLISGSYSFLFNGYDSAGTVMIAGSITTDGNGTVTGGLEDSNRVSTQGGALTGVITGIPLTGSYSLGTDGRGTMQLVATNPQTSVTLTTDYRIVLDSTGTIHFIQNNDITTPGVLTDTVGTHGEGIMKPVPTNFGAGAGSFSGNYSFLFSGQDMTAKPTALGGVINANGISSLIPAAGGVGGDLNDNGAFDGGTVTGLNISGAFSAGGSNNRGTASLLFEVPGKSQTTIEFAYYFVSPSDMFWVEIDESTTTQSPIFYRLSGEMIAQPANTPFGVNALTGTSVATGSALNGNNASVFAGLFTSA